MADTPQPAHPRVLLNHRTSYLYDRSVMLGPQVLRLRPLPDPRVPTPGFRLTIDPAPLGLHWMADPLGNQVARFSLAGPVERLDIEVAVDIDLVPRNPFDFMLEPHASRWPFQYMGTEVEAEALALYRRTDHPGPALEAMRAGTTGAWDTTALLTALGARVRDRLEYIVRLEHGTWPADRTLAEGRGSCRDFAWVLVQLLRMHNIAARFVSGYLIQQSDAGDWGAELHAWAEAYLPGAGWVGIDATSGYLTGEFHIAVAASPDPLGAAPLSGTMEAADSRLDTDITVRPVS